ncbi:50S ribosomal protein L44e [Candidatus Woesearchaeota archaeon]|nr:50S ribosomal protein L44e [Candidatus Woesearchaeota archaeon]
MKFPKTRKRYCRFCKKHTDHKLLESKKKTPGTAHPLSRGGKFRLRKRGLMKFGNRGRLSRRPVGQRSMTGKKQSKKIDLRYECSVCKKMSVRREGFRVKKVEFV